MNCKLCHRVPGAVLLLTVLIACGGSGGGGGNAPEDPGDGDGAGSEPLSPLLPDSSPDPALPAPGDDRYEAARDAARFLMQASFGPTAKSIDALLDTGNDYAAWIDAQLALPQTRHLPRLEDRFEAIGLARAPLVEDVEEGWLRDLQRSDIWWESTLWGEDQLRQRVAYALSQILVISNVSDALFNDSRGIAHYHDLLAAQVSGNYRELLEAVTLHPMMGQYLSMIRNEKADPQRNIRPDENYAREIMQLFSIGLVELNLDGSVKLDDDGQPIPTYGQEDVKELARVFTGWTHGTAIFWGQYVNSGDAEIVPMKSFAALHDSGAKTLLGQTIAAGLSPAADIGAALDILYAHPNVAPFISKQLIQRLVTSNPSPDYVARVATVFNNNGSGVKGDLGAMVRAILLDEEARTGHLMSSTSGKLKEPLLRLAALWRAFKAQGIRVREKNGSFSTNRLRYRATDRVFGQRPYGSFSVFNFYRPDYQQPGEIKDGGLYAPEFQIHTESQLTAGANAMGDTIFWRDAQDNDVNAQFAEAEWDMYPQRLYIAEEKALAETPALLLDRLNLLLMAGDMSSSMYNEILAYLNAQLPAGGEFQRRMMVYDALYLVCASPEFAVQR